MLLMIRNALLQRPVAVLILTAIVLALCILPLACRERTSGAQTEEAHDGHLDEAETHEEDMVVLNEEARQLAGIRTVEVESREIKEYIRVPGVIRANANDTATVSPSVAGTIESVKVNVGDHVRRGQVLVIIRSPELAEAQANAATAAAELAAAKEALKRKQALAAEGTYSAAPYEEAKRAFEEAQENLRLAESNLQRLQRLAELGAVSRPPAEEAAQELSEAREEVRVAEADVQAAQAALETARRLAARLAAESANGDNPTSVERSAAQAKLTEARAALEAARAERQRLQNLLPDGLATEQEVQESLAAEAAAKAEVTAAEVALRLIDKGLDEARLAVAASEQEFARSQAALTEAQARLQVAETRFQRQQTITSEDIPTKQQIAEAKKELQTARAAYEQARLALEREQRLRSRDLRSLEAVSELEAAVQSARARLHAAERTVSALGQGQRRTGGALALTAPVSGKISKRSARVGAMVEAGTPLLEITGLRTVWVEASVYEQDVGLVRPGQAMRITVQAYPGVVFEGTVESIHPVLDSEAKKAVVRGLVDNPEGRLMPGMFADVQLGVAAITAKRAIPVSALEDDGAAAYVFVEVAPNRFEKRVVTLGQQGGENVEVLDGLEPGEKVVVQGSFFLKSELVKETFEAGHGH